MEDWLSYRVAQMTGKHKQAFKYMERIAGFQPDIENGVRNFLQGNNLLSAWSLMRIKDRAHAQSWLKTQLNRHPDDNILKWNKEKFDQHELAQTQITAAELKILAQLLGFE